MTNHVSLFVMLLKDPAVALLTSQESHYYSIATFYNFLVVNGKRNVRKYALFSVRDMLLRCYQDK